jgi:hypothetical protein
MLSDAQIENWRRLLYRQGYGPAALLCPASQIQAIHDEVERLTSSKFCVCDRSVTGYTKHVNGRITCNKCHKPR